MVVARQQHLPQLRHRSRPIFTEEDIDDVARPAIDDLERRIAQAVHVARWRHRLQRKPERTRPLHLHHAVARVRRARDHMRNAQSDRKRQPGSRTHQSYHESTTPRPTVERCLAQQGSCRIREIPNRPQSHFAVCQFPKRRRHSFGHSCRGGRGRLWITYYAKPAVLLTASRMPAE
jgi:hypothetical protein